MVEVGQTISGKYKLLRLLGDGGMGSVFEAEHMRLGTHVAIKVLHTELARRSGIAERFVQEARVSAQIRSPHVVQVTDVDHTPEGIAYLVMELLQGETLSGVTRREKKLPVAQASEYTTQILQALEAAHALGVIHRDLKPDNVFVTFAGGKPVLKLIDFGIAKLKTEQTGATKNLTVAGMLMGTPEYMAPEQAYSADKVDVRADLYAVGVMMYEMLAGVPPVEAADPRVLIGKVERGEVTPLVQAAPGIEPMLAGFVHRAMAPRPELRFANATEMRIALEDISSGKRAGTAKLGVGVAHSSAQAAALGLADTAQPIPPAAAAAAQKAQASPQVLGTGTVMGAPVEAALSVTPNPQGLSVSPQPTPRGATQGVPAVPFQQQMSVMPVQQPYPSAHPPAMPVHGPGPVPGSMMESPRKKGGNGLIIALAIVAALLGAGAVVSYVMSTSKPPPVATVDLGTTPPPPTTPATVTPPPPSPGPGPVSTLTPGPQPLPSPGPGPAPAKKDGGAPAPGGKDAGGPIGPIVVHDAGGGQTNVQTPWGTVQVPGPRPIFWPPNEPWPPPTVQPPQ
ncbi:MAG: serine/threonine-protein kinase [Labilithrix sp.]